MKKAGPSAQLRVNGHTQLFPITRVLDNIHCKGRLRSQDAHGYSESRLSMSVCLLSEHPHHIMNTVMRQWPGESLALDQSATQTPLLAQCKNIITSIQPQPSATVGEPSSSVTGLFGNVVVKPIGER